MRHLLVLLGGLSLALGVAGIFLPLLPTTPFLLLTAALWVRSSPRLYAWLLARPRLGAYIRQYRENRAIPLRAKIGTLALMWGSTLGCVFGLLEGIRWAQAGLLLVGAAVTWHVARLATLKR